MRLFQIFKMALDHIDHAKTTFLLSTTLYLVRKLKGNDTYACFVDFKEAFDSINRDLLRRKLSLYGIRGQFLDTVKSMYQDFECLVFIRNIPHGLM